MIFIYGSDIEGINEQIKKIVNRVGSKPIVFDVQSPLELILLELQNMDIFNEKFILINDHEILKKKDVGKKIMPYISLFEGIEIIFALSSDKPTKSNPIIRHLIENAKTINVKELTNKQVETTIRKMVFDAGGKISNMAMNKLIERLPKNISVIKNEVSKLLLQSLDINSEMIETAISIFRSDDYFALTNAIMEFDKNKIFAAYNIKKIMGIDATIIIDSISKLLKDIKKVSVFVEQNVFPTSIPNLVKIHPFVVKKITKFLNMKSITLVDGWINDLAKLDVDFKTGTIDKDQGLDQFMNILVK